MPSHNNYALSNGAGLVDATSRVLSFDLALK